MKYFLDTKNKDSLITEVHDERYVCTKKLQSEEALVKTLETLRSQFNQFDIADPVTLTLSEREMDLLRNVRLSTFLTCSWCNSENNNRV